MSERTSAGRRLKRPRTNTTLASYRLGRAALDQRQFLAVELAALAEVPINTVYSFIADLGGRVTSEALASDSVGRPRKLYTLTDEAIDYLLDQNLEIARILRREGPVGSGRDAAQELEPPMAAAGTLLNELREMFAADHVEEATTHIDRLEQLRDRIDRKMRGTRRDSTAGVVVKQESALE